MFSPRFTVERISSAGEASAYRIDILGQLRVGPCALAHYQRPVLSVLHVIDWQYNTAILACCRAQQSVAALSLLGDMSVEGGELHENGGASSEGRVRPDETSYVHVMRAFGREGR